MFTAERQDQILSLIREKKSASVKELAAVLFTSEASIRRDLTALEIRGLVRRTYGGAILIEGNNIEVPLNVREMNNAGAKLSIGRMASALVENQDTIFLDPSSTTEQMCRFLGKKDDLTVITNGIHLITALVEMENISLYCIGGKVRRYQLSMVGGQAESFVQNFWASKYFFSCTSLSMLSGVMDYSDTEAEVRKRIMGCCEKKILLADSSKFTSNAFYKICGFDIVDVLITDKRPSDDWLSLLTSSKTTIIFPDEKTGKTVTFY